MKVDPCDGVLRSGTMCWSFTLGQWIPQNIHRLMVEGCSRNDLMFFDRTLSRCWFLDHPNFREE